MKPEERHTSAGRGNHSVLIVFLLGLVWVPLPVVAQESHHLASLNPARPASALPPETESLQTGRVAEVRSMAEALVLLHKLEAQLQEAPHRRVDVALAGRQADEAAQFLRKFRARRMSSARYQWHQVSRIRPEVGSQRLILRPLQAVPSVSTINLDVNGGPARIDVVRAYDASGVVYEFQPRQSFEPGASSGGSRFCLDREIDLTAVEIFCEPIAGEGLEVGVQGGLAIEPAPMAESYGLRALQLAQVEIQRKRYDQAARHIHNSIDLIKQIR